MVEMRALSGALWYKGAVDVSGRQLQARQGDLGWDGSKPWCMRQGTRCERGVWRMQVPGAGHCDGGAGDRGREALAAHGADQGEPQQAQGRDERKREPQPAQECHVLAVWNHVDARSACPRVPCATVRSVVHGCTTSIPRVGVPWKTVQWQRERWTWHALESRSCDTSL